MSEYASDHLDPITDRPGDIPDRGRIPEAPVLRPVDTARDWASPQAAAATGTKERTWGDEERFAGNFNDANLAGDHIVTEADFLGQPQEAVGLDVQELRYSTDLVLWAEAQIQQPTTQEAEPPTKDADVVSDINAVTDAALNEAPKVTDEFIMADALLNPPDSGGKSELGSGDDSSETTDALAQPVDEVVQTATEDEWPERDDVELIMEDFHPDAPAVSAEVVAVNGVRINAEAESVEVSDQAGEAEITAAAEQGDVAVDDEVIEVKLEDIIGPDWQEKTAEAGEAREAGNTGEPAAPTDEERLRAQTEAEEAIRDLLKDLFTHVEATMEQDAATDDDLGDLFDDLANIRDNFRQHDGADVVIDDEFDLEQAEHQTAYDKARQGEPTDVGLEEDAAEPADNSNAAGSDQAAQQRAVAEAARTATRRAREDELRRVAEVYDRARPTRGERLRAGGLLGILTAVSPFRFLSTYLTHKIDEPSGKGFGTYQVVVRQGSRITKMSVEATGPGMAKIIARLQLTFR